MIRYHIFVGGRVQGVGFRFFCEMNAKTLSLTGFVKNLDNGMVELEVQGYEDHIDRFIKTIKKGNRFIKVDEFYLEEKDLILNEKTFKSLY